MRFPEFEYGGGKRILFFTRGRGRGHAIPDVEIARELETVLLGVQIRFVSYGTGSETLADLGLRHVDLGFPDRNPYNETLVAAARLIGWLNPDLVVAHEEFPALPAAKIFDKPAILLTDWFAGADSFTMSTLAFADRIVFLDDAGHFAEPPEAVGRVVYAGPIVRRFRYCRKDRPRARAELQVGEDSFVVAVLPGSWREEDHPLVERVLGAFDRLPMRSKHLVWMAGADASRIEAATANQDDVLVKGFDPEIDRVMVAADVAVTNATRKTLHELEALGIPSVSIGGCGNPSDDRRSRGFTGNFVLERESTAAELAAAVLDAARREVAPKGQGDGAHRCARIIVEELN